MSRKPPRDHVAPVQRLRLRYAKRGRLRFASHRDFQRAFERALRRAGVPMAYSAGFSPHPKISYANAAPTGTASEAEYLEIGLAEERDPAELRQRIDEALPPGLDIIEVVVALALVGVLLPSRIGMPVEIASISIVVAIPLLRVVWLIKRWSSVRDTRYVRWAILLLVLVAVGPVLALFGN